MKQTTRACSREEFYGHTTYVHRHVQRQSFNLTTRLKSNYWCAYLLVQWYDLPRESANERGRTELGREARPIKWHLQLIGLPGSSCPPIALNLNLLLDHRNLFVVSDAFQAVIKANEPRHVANFLPWLVWFRKVITAVRKWKISKFISTLVIFFIVLFIIRYLLLRL